MSGYRMQRLGDELRVRISEIIPTLKDPRLKGIVSITRVEVSSDSKYAKVYISVLGGDEELRECLRGFRSSAGYIRHELAATMQLRYTPELAFYADTGLIRGRKTLDIIRTLEKDSEEQENGNDEP
jgi:ribosome-binding factor A